MGAFDGRVPGLVPPGLRWDAGMCGVQADKSPLPEGEGLGTCGDYSCGPAETSALPASLPVYLTKFLTKRDARSLALVSHSEASA